MKNEEFLRLCKAKVAEYTNSHMDKTDGKQITVQDVYVVWSCKTLQNSKALLSTTVPDGMYYELTYNGDKHELYLDAYKKFQNIMDNFIQAQAIAVDISALFAKDGKIAHPWDYYPELFEKEQKAYEEAEEARQWEEYMEKRRAYNAEWNYRHNH